MKLFDQYEAVKFIQEDMIFITHNGYLYYIYYSKYKKWHRHKNAGNDYITVGNYPDVDKDELVLAMNGVFPQKGTDLVRLLDPSELRCYDMDCLLEEDYPEFMGERSIHYASRQFLYESVICYKSYLELRRIFDKSRETKLDNKKVLDLIVKTSYVYTGRDIFKKEIGIIDGHDPSSYFWFRPVKLIDDSDANGIDCVAEMDNVEFSIEEDDVDQYLTPYLYKYFDGNLFENTRRVNSYWDEEEDEPQYLEGFEWNLTHNYYTFDSMKRIIYDIKETMDALKAGKDTDYTRELRIKRGSATNQLIYAKNLTPEQIKEYNDNRPTVDDTEADVLIDFYDRFVYRMEFMIRVGKERGFNRISVMGP